MIRSTALYMCSARIWYCKEERAREISTSCNAPAAAAAAAIAAAAADHDPRGKETGRAHQESLHAIMPSSQNSSHSTTTTLQHAAVGHLDRHGGPVAAAALHRRHLVHNLLALEDLAEDNVATLEPSRVHLRVVDDVRVGVVRVGVSVSVSVLGMRARRERCKDPKQSFPAAHPTVPSPSTNSSSHSSKSPYYHYHLTVVMKNCEPFVLGPALAIASL